MQGDILRLAQAWADEGHRVALATVIRTWGSSPRPAGSQLVVRDDSLFEGSVSGGCVEGRVVEAGLQVMADGAPQRLVFSVSNAEAWAVGLACGGEIEVYVQPGLPQAFLRSVNEARAAGRPVALEISLESGSVARATDAAAEACLRSDTPGLEEGRFILPLNPPLRLVVVGAVHIAQALAPMAALAGYAVTVVDPREGFARADRFPDVALSTEWPDDALAELGLDARTAVVTLTHDPKLDDPALQAALRSEAFYVGALGSKKTHAKRHERLAAAGFDDAARARVHGPVGLAIGARSPAEIAISILAEMTAVLRRS
ncbi:MAG: XdhC family protein [Myxococcales bacterium]|nr:XdhC family protein [Myxococcales bacterium]